jgi:mono/diheme cytochrome c family protein
MRTAWSSAIASAVLAVVLLGILIGFQVPAAKSAPTPPQSTTPEPTPAQIRHGGVPQKDSAEVQRGKAVFQQYCVTCHGAEGKGDGVSANGLPIKPQNLTEGRILNPLPDRFLFAVISHGGSAVGLSPLMPAFKPYLSDRQINELIMFVRTLAEPAFDARDVLPIPLEREGPVQPIFFSHVIHAGSMQIPCQYCHANARRGFSAGVPSVERCMGCHKIVANQGNPQVDKLKQYWERQEPIPWVRVFKLPEFSIFPHKQHVDAGLQCQTCHGRIDAMEQVAAVTGQSIVNDLQNLAGIPAAPPKLTMGWCVECHRTANEKGVAAVQNVAELPRPSVVVPAGTENKPKNAPLESFTCHH